MQEAADTKNAISASSGRRRQNEFHSAEKPGQPPPPPPPRFFTLFFCQDAPPKFSLACVTWSQLPPNVGRPRQQRVVSQRYILRKIYMCAHALLILSLSFLNTRTRRALVLLFFAFCSDVRMKNGCNFLRRRGRSRSSPSCREMRRALASVGDIFVYEWRLSSGTG
jgi:hypothetical protein